MPAYLHTSRCLSAVDIGPGTAASRRTASGPRTLYSLGEACHLYYKGLFEKVFLFNGVDSTLNFQQLSCDHCRQIATPPTNYIKQLNSTPKAKTTPFPPQNQSPIYRYHPQNILYKARVNGVCYLTYKPKEQLTSASQHRYHHMLKCYIRKVLSPLLHVKQTADYGHLALTASQHLLPVEK